MPRTAPLSAVMESLRRELLPKAPRDDWGSASEELAQRLDRLEKEFPSDALVVLDAESAPS